MQLQSTASVLEFSFPGKTPSNFSKLSTWQNKGHDYRTLLAFHKQAMTQIYEWKRKCSVIYPVLFNAYSLFPRNHSEFALMVFSECNNVKTYLQQLDVIFQTVSFHYSMVDMHCYISIVSHWKDAESDVIRCSVTSKVKRLSYANYS